MKPWQHGYELDTLIDWANKFEHYNKYCHSPFAKAKKNGMATALSKGRLHEQQGVVYEIRTAKTTSKIKMFGAGPEIASVIPGDKVISKLSYADGVTGENLLQLLEARLDNVVYRLGISPTRRSARQLVSHKHITVNGNLVNIPSYTLKEGDMVAVREKSKSLTAISSSVSNNNANKYKWLEWDDKSLLGKLVTYPDRESIPENINEQLIVELYSK